MDASEKQLQATASGASLALAFQTVEASLRAEDWFFQTIRKALEEKAPLSDFPTIMGSNGHDYLLHFTQFLFFLRALDCTDAEAVAQFIDAHNLKIKSLLDDPEFSKSKNEFKKAVIRPERKAKILDSIRALNTPVFAIYEFGHLLIDDMSPKTTEKLIEDLRHGGLLTRRIDDRIEADAKRTLIASTGVLEDTYCTSLLMQRRMIAHSMDAEEFARAKA